MTQGSEPQFDDPVLKEAIRRVSASEQAPADLRKRVQAAMNSQPAHMQSPRRMFIGRQPLRTLLAACVALFAIGLVAYEAKVNFFPQRPSGPTYSPTISTSFAEAMVKAHSRNAALKTPTTMPADQLAQLQQTLSSQLGYPVLLPGDLGDGWENHGAGSCEVGQTKAAYGLYAKGGLVITLLSLPGSVLHHAPQDTDYAQMAAGAPISGFKHGAALYCLVASPNSKAGSLTLELLNTLRDRLRALTSNSACAHTCASHVQSI